MHNNKNTQVFFCCKRKHSPKVFVTENGVPRCYMWQITEVVYQIMYCTGWKCRLCAKSKQINVKYHKLIPGIPWSVWLDLAYPVQYMIWYTTSDIYSPYNRLGRWDWIGYSIFPRILPRIWISIYRSNITIQLHEVFLPLHVLLFRYLRKHALVAVRVVVMITKC